MDDTAGHGAFSTPITTGEGLRLYLDSANPDHWHRFLPTGAFYGVTTNPLLLERSGQACTLPNLERLTRMATELGAAEIHLQTWGDDETQMEKTGQRLACFSDPSTTVAVKVPATEAGFRVARRLAEAGCPVTLTAVYNPSQVVLASGFGAAYAAPYLGRISDQGQDGRATIIAMRDILRSTGSATRLLVASLRSAGEVVDLARIGMDTMTFGAPVAAELFQEEKTAIAAGDFLRAAAAMDKPDSA